MDRLDVPCPCCQQPVIWLSTPDAGVVAVDLAPSPRGEFMVWAGQDAAGPDGSYRGSQVRHPVTRAKARAHGTVLRAPHNPACRQMATTGRTR